MYTYVYIVMSNYCVHSYQIPVLLLCTPIVFDPIDADPANSVALADPVHVSAP